MARWCAWCRPPRQSPNDGRVSLARTAIRRPVALSMATVALLLLGGISLARLPVDLLPAIEYPSLVVRTFDESAAPTEMERLVTEPVERVASAIPGVERVESISRPGVSLVTLRFAWGTEMNFAVLQLREQLDLLRSSLPDGAERPEIVRSDPAEAPIATVTLTGADPQGTRELAGAVVRRRLEQLDGVAQAAVTGGREREVQVEIPARTLESLGLTLQGVAAAISASNQRTTGGTVLRGRTRFTVRTLGQLRSVEDLAAVVIARGDSAPPVVLGDIARIADGLREQETIARSNGREAVGVLVYKEPGANTVSVTRRLERELGVLRAQYPGLQISLASSQARFIQGAIGNVVQEMVAGAALAVLVLFLFLRDPRVPLVIGLVIPVSVVATFALLDAAGVSLNLISLGGLALGVGLLLDNAIVVVENIMRRRAGGLTPLRAAEAGTAEVTPAIVASTLTTIAVFGPIVYVRGVAGRLFAPLSLSVAAALAVSALAALTLVPMITARWALRAHGAQDRGSDPSRARRHGGAAHGPPAAGRPAPEPPLPASHAPARVRLTTPLLDAVERGFAWFTARYERALGIALEHPGATMGIVVACAAITLVVGASLPRSVLPGVDEGAFQASLVLPAGTPLERTDSAARSLEALLRANPAVDAVLTRAGRESGGLGDGGANMAVLSVRLRPGATAGAAMARLRPRLPAGVTLGREEAGPLAGVLGSGTNGLEVRVQREGSDGAAESAGGIAAAPESAAPARYANAIAARLATAPGLASVRVLGVSGHPELEITARPERTAAFGLEQSEVSQAVDGYLRGVPASGLAVFGRSIPILVRLPVAERSGAGSLRLVRVSGVPLRELVTVRERDGPAEVRRVDRVRTVVIAGNITAGGTRAAERTAAAVLARVPPPPGLRATIGGENEQVRSSVRSLSLAIALSVLLVYMILAAEFESLVHPLLVLLTVPLGTAGAAVALWLAGAGLNAVSLIGVVVLVGIVDNDAVVKVDFINAARRDGMQVREAVLAAGHARLRPIIINSLTAMLGVLPMALGIGPGAALQAPLAIALFGGLLSATVLTLVVVPVGYELSERARVRCAEALRRWLPRPPPRRGSEPV